jgi:hypothetical protein
MGDLHQTLRDLHRELADAPRLDPADRALLEAAVQDIQATLATAGGQQSAAPETSPADTLESAAVRIEADHPGLAGAVRSIIDALAKAGI